MPISDAEKAVDGSGMLPEARYLVKQIQRVVVHEMTHAGQSILLHNTKDKRLFDYKNKREITRSRSAPTKSRTPQYKQHQNRDDSELHHLDDVEFYTDLRDGIREVMSKFEYHSEHRTLKAQEKNLLLRAL